MDADEKKGKPKQKRRGRKGAIRWREEIGKYVIDFYDNMGKRHIETAGTNWRDANTELDKRMNEVNNGVYVPRNQDVLFKDYVARWIKNKVGVKERIKISYEGIIGNHLVPFFGEARLIKIQRKDIQDFVEQKIEEQRPSPKTIHNMLLVLHQILADAQVDKVIFQTPYLKIERPKIVKTERDYLKTDEIMTFLENCDGQSYPIFYTAIFTGERRGGTLGAQVG